MDNAASSVQYCLVFGEISHHGACEGCRWTLKRCAQFGCWDSSDEHLENGKFFPAHVVRELGTVRGLELQLLNF